MTNRVLDPDELLEELRHDADLCRRYNKQTNPICGQAADRIEALQSLLSHPVLVATINMNAHHPELATRAEAALKSIREKSDHG